MTYRRLGVAVLVCAAVYTLVVVVLLLTAYGILSAADAASDPWAAVVYDAGGLVAALGAVVVAARMARGVPRAVVVGLVPAVVYGIALASAGGAGPLRAVLNVAALVAVGVAVARTVSAPQEDKQR